MKKIISLILAVCLLASIASVAAVTASANAKDAEHRKLIGDVLNSEEQVETNTYYFYLPESWKNEYNDYYNYNNETKTFDGAGGNFAAGIYWWEGPYNCKDYKGDLAEWPGYAVMDTQPEDANIYKAEVPKSAGKFIWNNLVDGGQDKTNPVFYAAIQTEDISNEFYDPDEDGYGFYPNGTESFDGMIYVCNPKATEENILTPGKFTFKGAWFYYYGNGEYGIYKTREEAAAANAVYKNGEFPNYALTIDPESASVEVGESATITPNDNTAVASVADSNIANISQNENTGVVTVTGLCAGTTEVTFTKDNNGDVETVKCAITVTGEGTYTMPDPNATQPASVETQPASQDATEAPTQAPSKPATVTKKANTIKVSAVNKTFKAKKLKKKAQSYKAIKVSKAQGKVTYKVTKKNKKLTFKNGKITVKKKTKKGTYKITVKVTAAGNKNYKAKSVTKTVKVKVK